MAVAQHYRAIVVGGGPAGIASVGNLLDKAVAPVLWIDDKFDGGRLHRKYREVPSNTKVSLFLDFANACDSLRKAHTLSASKTGHTAYSTLETLEQGKGCSLKHAADLCRQLTEGLQKAPEIHMGTGKVLSASIDKNATWSVIRHQSGRPVINTTPLLVMCTGSHPNAPVLPQRFGNLNPIDLDTALNPPVLSDHIPKDGAIQKVAVIGASHSAILILRNLCNLSKTTHPNLRILWFSRHALRYAEYKGDWILRDNTGLKGEAAEWAKANLEDDVFPQSGLTDVLQRVNTSVEEDGKYSELLPGCQWIIEATGFTRNVLPDLAETGVLSGKQNQLTGINYESISGGLQSNDRTLPGLYGAGIAFPQQVTDPLGNTEMAVGLWKFMKYLKGVVPKWINDT